MPRQKKQVLKQRKDGRYCAVYKGIQFMANSSDEALQMRQDYINNEKAGIGKVVSVSEYAKKWLPIAYPAVADSTYHGYAIHMEKLVSVIGNLPIKRVTPLNIKEVYSQKYLGLSNSYIKAGRQLFCSFFDAAVADGLCRSNPAKGKEAKPFKGKPVKKVEFTPQHRWWIENLCTDHRCHALAMTMLYAGLRPPEAKALKIERDVDFKAETITLHEFAHKDGQKYDYTGVGKNERASRTIPLFPPLKTALKGKEGYLITSAHGEKVTIQTFKVAWNSYLFAMETAINGMQKRWYGRTKEHKKILAEAEKLRQDGKDDEADKKQAEIPEWIQFKITPYTLRKAFCRWCRDNGVELNTCIRWMGHADAKMILEVYDEVSDDRDEREAERLKALYNMQNDMQDAEQTAVDE